MKYAPSALEKLNDESKTPTYSSFHCAFSVDGEMEELNDLMYFQCEALDVGCQVYERIGVKNYRKYGPTMAPAGQTLIQCSFIQYPEDFRFWTRLRQNKKQYDLHKRYIVDAVLDRLETRFPEYRGKIHPVDSWTPATYSRYLNSHNGLYMRYITKPINTNIVLSSEVKDLKNVFLAGHVLIYPGGTPVAAITGRMAIGKVENAEKTLMGKIPVVNKIMDAQIVEKIKEAPIVGKIMDSKVFNPKVD